MTQASVGLDFGMTNTVLYYYSDDDERPVAFKSPSAGMLEAIPTIVRKTSGAGKARSLIGLIAKRFGPQQDAHGEVRRYFKLGLPLCGDTKAARRAHPDFCAAHDFLSALFSEFLRESGFDGVRSIVVTAPEEWLNSHDQAGPNALRHILQDLRLPQPQFVSEPVAAAAFFAHKYKRQNIAGFDGYVLVYDHGGGTLDYSFVRIKSTGIVRIDGGSMSTENDRQAYGGVAYDEAVFRALCVREPAWRKLSASAKDGCLDAIEEVKRHTLPFFEAAYRDTLQEGEQPDVFLKDIEAGGKQLDVHVSDLAGVFSDEFERPIKSRLKEFAVFAKGERPAADFLLGSNFRVLAVGGFSEFYPVRRLVQAVFTENFGSSANVFKDNLAQHERWSAIARGACLISHGDVTVDDLFPFTFGLVYYDANNNPHDVIIFDRKEPQSSYEGGREIAGTYRLFSNSPMGTATLEFFLLRSGRRQEILTRTLVREALPDFGSAKHWKLAGKLQNGVASVCFKSGKRQKTLQLGEIIDLADREIGGLILDR